MAKPKTVETQRVLLVKTADGELRVTLPDDAKLTFGPAIPYERKGGDYGPPGRNEYALRVYKGTKDNLLAVFAGVREFRDVDMPVEKLVIREAGKSVWKSDETGYHVETAVKHDKSFVKEIDLLGDGKPETPF